MPLRYILMDAPDTQKTSRKMIAHFCTGSCWLHIETGRLKMLDKQDRTFPMSASALTSLRMFAKLCYAFDNDSDKPVKDEQHF